MTTFILVMLLAAPMQEGMRAWNAGDVANAASKFREAPKDARAQLALATLESIEGNLDEALAAADATLALPTVTPEQAAQAQRIRATVLQEKGLKQSALGRRVLRYEVVLRELRGAVELRDAVSVRRWAGHALSLQPTRWEAPAAAGQYFLEEGLFEDASRVLRAAVASAPSDVRQPLVDGLALAERESKYRAEVARGIGLYASGNYAEALTVLEPALTTHPEAPAGVLEALEAATHQHEWDRAQAIVEKHAAAAGPRSIVPAEQAAEIARMVGLLSAVKNARPSNDEGPAIGDLSDEGATFLAEMESADRDARAAEQAAVARANRLRREIAALQKKAEDLREELDALPNKIQHSELIAAEAERVAQETASQSKDVIGGLLAVGVQAGSVAARVDADKFRQRISTAQEELAAVGQEIADKQFELADGDPSMAPSPANAANEGRAPSSGSSNSSAETWSNFNRGMEAVKTILGGAQAPARAPLGTRPSGTTAPKRNLEVECAASAVWTTTYDGQATTTCQAACAYTGAARAQTCAVLGSMPTNGPKLTKYCTVCR